jgi:hypothetical protein
MTAKKRPSHIIAGRRETARRFGGEEGEGSGACSEGEEVTRHLRFSIAGDEQTTGFVLRAASERRNGERAVGRK